MQRLLKEAPISASSLGAPRASSCFFLTTRATLDHHASSPSTLRQTAPIIIGTCSSPVWNQDKFTATVSREPQIPQRECDLIPPRYSSIHTVAVWLCLGNYSRDSARQVGDNAATAMKSVVVDPRAYDWEGDIPLNRPWSRTIIYEMHVRGFTRHPSSGFRMKKRGTYAGLIEKIPYLQELGITAVELLPVFQFDAQDCPGLDSSTTGVTRRCPSLRPIKPTARVGIGSARWMSFAIW